MSLSPSQLIERKELIQQVRGFGPKYLAKIPIDLFSGKALIYRPTKWATLYSVGVNGKDEKRAIL